MEKKKDKSIVSYLLSIIKANELICKKNLKNKKVNKQKTKQCKTKLLIFIKALILWTCDMGTSLRNQYPVILIFLHLPKTKQHVI